MMLTLLKGGWISADKPVHAVDEPLISTSNLRVVVWTMRVILDQGPAAGLPQLTLPLGTVLATRVVEPGACCKRIRRLPMDVPAPCKDQINEEPELGLTSIFVVTSVADVEIGREATKK